MITKELENRKAKRGCISSWHITVCIAEVRIFDAGSDRNHSKIEKQKNNKRTNVDQCSSAGTTDGERSNAHCFNVQPVFWQVSM